MHLRKLASRANVTFAIAVLLSTSTFGCGSGGPARRSGTLTMSERITVTYLPVTPKEPLEEAAIPAALATGAELGKFAINLALSAAEYLIRKHAEQYAATYSGATAARLDGLRPAGLASGNVLTEGGVIVLLRSVEAKSELSDGLATDAGLIGLPAIRDDDALKMQIKAQIELDPVAIANSKSVEPLNDELIQAACRAHFDKDRPRVLTFAAIAAIVPRRSQETFELRLIAYQYGALKTRTVAVPFYAKAGRVDSQFLLRVEGPTNVPNSRGGQFTVDAAFALDEGNQFHEKNAALGNPKWIRLDSASGSPYRSKPIANPQMKDIFVTATVVETSNFKKTLEKVADQIAKLKQE